MNAEQSDYPEFEQEAQTEQAPDKGSEKGETVLVPLASLGEVSPGDTVTFKVTHVYETEVALEPVGEEPEEEPAESEDAMEQSMAALGRMSEESEGMGY